MATEAGVCRVCGCTHDVPCPDGCTWVNAEQTLCSGCVGLAGRERVILEELWRQNRAEPGEFVAAAAIDAALGHDEPVALGVLRGLEVDGLVVADDEGFMTHAAWERFGMDCELDEDDFLSDGDDADEIDTQLEEGDPLQVLGHVDDEGRVHFVEGSDVA